MARLAVANNLRGGRAGWRQRGAPSDDPPEGAAANGFDAGAYIVVLDDKAILTPCPVIPRTKYTW